MLYGSSVATDGSNSPSQSLNIWTMNADGSGQTPLTKLNNASADPGAWSPDGTRIVYLSERAFDGSDNQDTNSVLNVWLMQADGSGSVPLTTLTKADSNFPAWKP